MIYLNRLEVIGNLTKDPEVRFTPNNQAVASFALATNRRYRDTSGNWVDAPAEYHYIVAWGNIGERCGQLLHKGDRVFVSGRLQTRSWEAQDGSKRYRTELIADSIIGPDQINKGGTGGSGADYGAQQGGGFSDAAPSAPKASKPSAPSADEEINIDDIPF